MFLPVCCRWFLENCFLGVFKFKGFICLFQLVVILYLLPQTCVKYCTQAERDAVFEELQPQLLTLACNTYAVHLVKKMLDNGMFSFKGKKTEEHCFRVKSILFSYYLKLLLCCLQPLRNIWQHLCLPSMAMLLLFFVIWLDLLVCHYNLIGFLVLLEYLESNSYLALIIATIISILYGFTFPNCPSYVSVTFGRFLVYSDLRKSTELVGPSWIFLEFV